MPFRQTLKGLTRTFILILLVGLVLLTACSLQPAAGEGLPPSATPTALAQGSTGPEAATPTPDYTTGGAVATLPASLVDPNCTYSPYYWLNNPGLWLTDNVIIGKFTYTREDALAVLAGSTDDSTNRLLRQFFTAALNILKGADASAIEADMLDASDWLNAHPPGYDLTSADRREAEEIASRIEAYNGGLTGPGGCKDEPPTPTPLPTSTPTITPTPTRTPVLPSSTPTVTPTEKFSGGGVPTAAAPTQNVPPTNRPSQPPEEPTPRPPIPTSAPEDPPTSVPEPPTAAPPPPEETTPPEEPPAPTSAPDLIVPTELPLPLPTELPPLPPLP